MGPKHSRRLALDTNILLDLAGNVPEVLRFFQVAAGTGHALAASATVLAELDFAFSDETNPRLQQLAARAQELMMTAWEVVPLPEPFRMEDAENFSLMLRTRGVLPAKERNDGLIIAECSLEGIGLLVTSDQHLHKMDQGDLAVVFNDFSPRLPTPVAIFHHTRITYLMNRK